MSLCHLPLSTSMPSTPILITSWNSINMWPSCKTRLLQNRPFDQSIRTISTKRKVLWGCPVSIRRYDGEAYGTAAGVAIVSEVPFKDFSKPDLPGWNLGRSQEALIFPSQAWLRIFNFYGYAQSGKCPDAHQRSTNLLNLFIDHQLKQAQGPCLLAGDFNLPRENSTIFRRLTELGWREAEEEFTFRFGETLPPTCKGATSPVMIWLNPCTLR